MIIGPQRTGTTWLYRNLRQHPRLFFPDFKETYFFSTLGDPGHPRFRFQTLEEYLKIFRDSPSGFIKKNYDCLRKSHTFYYPTQRGEATASYATLPEEVIREITLFNPSLKAILMLRDPIERAWSHFKKDLLRGDNAGNAVTLSTCQSFFEKQSQQRLADYDTMVDQWKKHLKPGHLFLGDFQKIKEAPSQILKEILSFLGVTTKALFQNRHLTETINPTDKVEMSEEIHAYLHQIFAKEVASYRRLKKVFSSSSEELLPHG